MRHISCYCFHLCFSYHGKYQLKRPFNLLDSTHPTLRSTVLGLLQAAIQSVFAHSCIVEEMGNWTWKPGAVCLYVKQRESGRRRTTELISQEELTEPSQVAQRQSGSGRHWWGHGHQGYTFIGLQVLDFY